MNERTGRADAIRFLEGWRKRLIDRPAKYRAEEEWGQLVTVNTILSYINDGRAWEGDQDEAATEPPMPRTDGRDGRPWHITGARVLTFGERLRVLFGTRIYARFKTPDGQCHAACDIDFFVQHKWPRDDEQEPWLHKVAGNRQSWIGRGTA